MTNKHKFNQEDDITSDDLFRYFQNKGIITEHQSVSCPLCRGDSFTFTDSAPFFPTDITDVSIKYRLSLTPTLIKPLPLYLAEYEQEKKKLLDEGKEPKGLPLDLIMKNTEVLNVLTQSYARQLILLTCNNCGHTHMIERSKVVDFLMNESKE